MTFQRVCSLAELVDDEPRRIELDDVDVAIVRTEGEVFAIHDECSHASIPLSEGDIDDCHVECWLHGSRFDLRTGKPTGLPATEPVATFPVDVRDGDVYVDIEQSLNGVTPA